MKMKQETIKPGRLNNSRCRHFTSSPQGSTARAAKKPPSPNATLPQANFSGASKVEAVPENQLADEMVGRARDADAKAEIDFPLRRNVEVDGRKNLVLLLAHWVEAGDRPQRAVVFQAAGDFLREVVAEFEIRRKLEAAVDIRAVESAVHRGIERKIPASELLVHDGPNFPSPRVFRKNAALVADFVGKTHADRPAPFCRDTHARADMIAHPVPALAVAEGSENIKAHLKPVVETVGDLNRFVERMIRGQYAVLRSLRAAECEVAVQLDHRVAGRDGFVGIDLDFVVVLGGGANGENGTDCDQKPEKAEASKYHGE